MTKMSISRATRQGLRTIALVGVLLGLCGLVAPPAFADTTIGKAQTYQLNCSSMMVVQAGSAGPSYTVPAGGGTITSWSVQAGDNGGTVQLLVWRPTAAADTYTLIGISTQETFAPNTGLITYSTSIAVEVGDLLGLSVTGDCGVFTNDPGDTFALFPTPPTPALNADQFFPPSLQFPAQLNVEATVVSNSSLTALSPVHAFIGLKNSDDQGTQFDVQAELLKNDVVVATGVQYCITGVTRNPSLAKEAIIPWGAFPPVPVSSGDVLSVRLSARIGTISNVNTAKCAGPGGSHNSATGLRLYYDATGQQSRFDATIGSNVDANLYLHSDGGVCGSSQSAGVTTRFLDPNAPTGTMAKCKDSGAVNFSGGNPWREIGTWSETAP